MIKQINLILIIFLPITFLLTLPVFATQTTYTFYPTADTFLTGYEQLNSNNGLQTNLRIQHPPRFSNVILKFSQQDLTNTLAGLRIVSASLQVYIETNFNNWSSGSYVDAYRMSYDWSETGATYNCDDDTNTANTNPDCEELWVGGYYEDYISDSLLHQNNETGWKSFNVTSDVQLFLHGEDHYGWLLRKRSNASAGSVDYTSIQGTSAQKPRLVVITDNTLPACSPTIIESVTPAVVPSNGNAQQITVVGQNLDHITQVKVDNSAVTFTLVNAQTITFSVSYSAVGTHEIWFRSDCLTEPLNNYLIQSDSSTYGTQETVSCTAPGTVTYFSRGGTTLCWKPPTGGSVGARMIGYSGDFTLHTMNIKWDTDTNGDGVNDDDDDDQNPSTDRVRGYFNRAQYKSGSGSRGANFVRLLAIGASCNSTAGPQNCVGAEEFLNNGHESELMPFKVNDQGTPGNSDDRYIIQSLSENGKGLEINWKKRLKNTIKYADKNGIAVMIDLFDENTTMLTWSKNPWNRNHNDMTCTELPTNGAEGLPDFYKICSDYTSDATCNDSLNCLGKREKAYVKSVVAVVKKNLQCGDGTQRCKNVLFEVMNEARFDESWSASDLTLNQFKVWHNTVARWIKSRGAYMVAATVKAAPANNPCGSDDSDFCRLDACGSTSCANYFDVFFKGCSQDSDGCKKIDIVSLHWPTWGLGTDPGNKDPGDICNRVDEAQVFGKPVIFDDDGGHSTDGQYGRNKNDNVETWAQNVSDSNINLSCGQSIGNIHFYHTGDGSHMEGTAPSICSWIDIGHIDCEVWDSIADGLPTKYCGTGGATSCQTRVLYCENKSGQCPHDNK